MNNKERIQQIVDSQIEKIYDLSKTAKAPLMLGDIKSLSELAKIINDSENLDLKQRKEIDEFSPEELIMIYEHRQKKKKEAE
jgi:hypothetical protein